jgi:pyruvate/2-oxoglutarate dehydrogenase complex dihydrolipoamide acyltransferase (E2) component
MPKLGMYLEDVRLVEWLCDEGAEVSRGELIFTLETDKVTTDVEADAAGFLHRIVPAGEMVAIGARIGSIAETREEYEQLVGPAAATDAPPAAAPASAGAGFEAAQSELFLNYIRAADDDEAPVEEPEPAPAERPRAARAGRPISPRARALITKEGLPPEVVEQIPGSGPGGRMTDKDVRAFLSAGGAREAAAPSAAPSDVPVAERIPLTGIRRVIARRMLESLQTSAQLTSILEVDVGAVVDWRNRSEPRVGYTAIFTALAAQALRRHPGLNARLADDAVEVFADVNVGVAVSTDGGVVVPVVHQADRLSLAELNARIALLTERARGGTITSAELAGGTFTLSNNGTAPVDITTAILNPPQAAILWLGRIKERAVVRHGGIAIRPTVQVCLTYDHRVLDGVPAASFLGTLEELCASFPGDLDHGS